MVILQQSKCLMRLWIFLVLFAYSFLSPGYAEAATENAYSPTIRIGLMTRQYGIQAGSNGRFEIYNADTGTLLGEYAGGEKIRVGLREGKFVLNNSVVEADRLRIEPAKTKTIEREDRLIDLNNRRYRGNIEIFRTQGLTGMTAVNVLTVDDYVYGVLARSLSPEWPEQAIKAQAVTLRSFALYSVGKHKNEGFDLCSTNDCQLYEGQTAEDAKIKKAIEDTRGMVLIYQGYLAAAYLHLSGGGYTENSETVITKAYAYLRGVPDFDQTSPYFSWQKKISPVELETILKGAGYNIGPLTAIELSKRTPAPMKVADRGVSGRVRIITFLGKDGLVSLTGEKLEQMLSLPSRLFDVSIAVPRSNIKSDIIDSFGDYDTKQIQINLPPASSAPLLNEKQGVHRFTGQQNEMVFFDGAGSGHGLGLSQWGAKAMAEKAINPGPDYYVSILKHYFRGVMVNKWY